MTSLLVFFHVRNIATLTQVKAIYCQPYFHMCISVSQPVRNIGMAVFAGIAVFAHLERHYWDSCGSNGSNSSGRISNGV